MGWGRNDMIVDMCLGKLGLPMASLRDRCSYSNNVCLPRFSDTHEERGWMGPMGTGCDGLYICGWARGTWEEATANSVGGARLLRK